MRDKIYSVIVLIPLIILGMSPPIAIKIPPTVITWYWLVLLSCFLAIAFCYINIGLSMKLLVSYGLLNCLMSYSPYISFSAFIAYIICVYIFLLSIKIKNWNLIFNSIQVLLFFNILIIIMQALKRDVLFNFRSDDIVYIGKIGNLMQFKSFILLLVSFIIQDKRLSFKRVVLPISILLGLGLLVYFLTNGHLKYFTYARGGVWLKSVSMTLHPEKTVPNYQTVPLFGYGLGGFSTIFPVLASGPFTLEGAWTMAHNFFVESLFELGTIGFSIILGLFSLIIYRCRKNLRALIGIGFTFLNMSYCFPDRMIESALIMVVFLAYLWRIGNEQKDMVISSVYSVI